MPFYRKRPIVVQAEQWHHGTKVQGVSVETEDEAVDIEDGDGVEAKRTVTTRPPRHYVVTIHNQRAYLNPGDFVITEPDGVHHYPCKPEIFEASYEPMVPGT